MKYKCILFDCDGVLVDSESISAKVFREMALEMGCTLSFETILKQITGTSMQENIDFLEMRTGKKLPANFEKEYRKRTYKRFQQELKPVDGIHSLLGKIKVPVGVASSGPVEKIIQNLKITGLYEFFADHIFSCYEIGSWKPDPGIYLHAAKSMGFLPGECVVVEDSEAGVKAALAGGFDVFALNGKTINHAFSGVKPINHLSELEALLGL